MPTKPNTHDDGVSLLPLTCPVCNGAGGDNQYTVCHICAGSGGVVPATYASGLVAATYAVIAVAADYYTARNGRKMLIGGDDG